jgi:hypothetical protein
MLMSVYDLTTAHPHQPPQRRYSADEWRVYVEGYDWALIMCCRVLWAAQQRHALFERTRRLEAQRRRQESRT